MSAITHNRLNGLQNDIFIHKAGYDYWNKKMIARVYTSLEFVVTKNERKNRNWMNVIKEMTGEKRPGYYNSIRNILKDIKVIEYEMVNGVKSHVLQAGPNWDKFFDMDITWDWFITDTANGGIGTIVK